jgi:hypothetical protein
MEILPLIIDKMSKEEVRFFKLYATRMEYSADRKQLKLFDIIRKGEKKYDDNKVIQKVYLQQKRNAFYKLKHKLLEQLGQSLLQQYSQQVPLLEQFQWYSLYLYFNQQNNFQVAFYYLKKAEKAALKQEQFDLLDMIYMAYIQLCIEIVEINPEKYIVLQKKNQDRLLQLRQMEQLLAVFSYRLKITQNYSLSANSIFPNLGKDNPIDKKNKAILSSPKLVDMICKELIDKRDYATLEKYATHSYANFAKKNWFTATNHNLKLQLLTYIVNAAFKNEHYKVSLKYTDFLQKAMLEYNQALYDRFELFYVNALVINYCVVDLHQAASLLEDLKNKKKVMSSYYGMFVWLNAGMVYFHLKQFDKSIKQFVKLYLLESFKSAAIGLQLKIVVAELIVRYEAKDENFKTRLRQTHQLFKVQFQQESFKREGLFLNLLETAIDKENSWQSKEYLNKVKVFLKTRSIETEDSEIIKYNNWLMEKIK